MSAWLTPTVDSTLRYPLRKTLLAVESIVALAALEGAVQLAVGASTPPSTDLPFGLHSWLLPGLWLFGSVAVPYAVAAVLAFHRDARAPTAAQIAGAALILELLSQIPFLGFSVLQPVLAVASVTTVL